MHVCVRNEPLLDPIPYLQPKWIFLQFYLDAILTYVNLNIIDHFRCIKIQPKAPAKRSQHGNATYRNIIGRNMLCAFGHRVAKCCDMLAVVGSSLTIFKLEPTTPNTSQHIATWWPNAHNMLRLTMLRYVVLACCDRLAGA